MCVPSIAPITHGKKIFSENFVETFACDCASNGQQIYSSLREPNADITLFLHVTTVESDTLNKSDIPCMTKIS